MNYLSHGRFHLDDPWALAGTALPDWLRILDRRNRLRAHALPTTGDDDDPRVRALVRGVRAHFADDAWFHVHPAFDALLSSLTLELRARAPGVRASVLAHILVEMLLDAELMRRDASAVDRYYQGLAAVDLDTLDDAVRALLPRPTRRLPELVAYFVDHAWVRDYAHDDGVLLRLSGLSARVGLGALPRGLEGFVATARAAVAREADALLARGPMDPDNSPDLHGSPEEAGGSSDSF